MKFGSTLMLFGAVSISIANTAKIIECGDEIAVGCICSIGCAALIIGAVILNLGLSRRNRP